ncbi:electron transfer flavoprotein subunit alpha/FixB family protein, partial [Brevibacillus agri]
MKKVLVLTEVRDGQLRNVSLEALAAAQALAEGGEIVAGVFGADAAAHAPVLAQHGASTVYTADHEALAQYTPDAYTQALVQLIELASPDAVILGHTAIGRDVAPRVAAKLGYGLVSDVTSIEAGPVFVRPIYAGKAFQQRKFVDGKIFITIRPNNIAIGTPDAAKKAIVVPVDLEIKDLRTIVKEVV